MTGSLRERLRARPLPSITYPLLIQPSELQPALTALAIAERHHRQAVLREETWEEYRKRLAKTDQVARREDYRKHAARVQAEITDQRAAVDTARAAVQACYEQIQLTALPPTEYEALRALHPGPAGERESVATETFRPALLAACAAGDMTEQDWAAFFADNVSAGEGQELYVAALMVNESPSALDVSLGKGWNLTPGSSSS